MTLSRREFVQASIGAALGTSVPALPALSQKSLLGPRYFVVLFLRGGMDAIYTTDPKTRADVGPKVDVPYNANEIVSAGGLAFGPHFKRLARWAPKMAVVRGIQVKTANHESGALQALRMKTAVSPNMPGLLDIIGQRREQPLASVTIGRTSSLEHSPGAFGGPTGDSERTVVDALDGLSKEEFAILEKTYRGHLAGLPKWRKGSEVDRTRDHLEQATALFKKMQSTPQFKEVDWPGRDALGRDMQRTLWMLENDISRGIFVKVFLDWDSHYANARKQTGANETFTLVLDRFLEELHARKNQHGVLADQTMLVFGSELGRFPLLNGNDGKDHFPETTMTFMGPNINTDDGKGAAFVPTGKSMEGVKISLKTGKPDDAGSHIFLDDVGTTMIAAAGLNPEVYGYRGRRLSFLERA